jgi:hypothetical protein
MKPNESPKRTTLTAEEVGDDGTTRRVSVAVNRWGIDVDDFAALCESLMNGMGYMPRHAKEAAESIRNGEAQA